MPLVLLLCSQLLAASPAPPPAPVSESAQFWFFLDDVPVGSVELKLEGTKYEYRSTHYFGGSPKKPKQSAFTGELSAERTIDDRVPVSLFLLLRSKEEHCADVFDELTGEKGTACVNDRMEDVDVGNALGTRYRARYQDGRLQELTIGEGVFRRSEGTPPPPPDIFAAGIPVSGVEGTLAFIPEQPKKRRFRPLIPTLFSRDRIDEWIRAARATLSANETGACVRLADEVVKRVGRSSAEIVYGVVLEGARVYPHAWVRVLSSEREDWYFDPAMDVEVKPTTHLEIPDNAGETYLQLWSGTLKVTRIPIEVEQPKPDVSIYR